MGNEKKTLTDPKPKKPVLPDRKEPKPGQIILGD